MDRRNRRGTTGWGLALVPTRLAIHTAQARDWVVAVGIPHAAQDSTSAFWRRIPNALSLSENEGFRTPRVGPPAMALVPSQIPCTNLASHIARADPF